MAYDPGAIDATLAAAVGDEPALIAELRMAFVDSAERAIATIEAATDDAGMGAWRRPPEGIGGEFRRGPADGAGVRSGGPPARCRRWCEAAARGHAALAFPPADGEQSILDHRVTARDACGAPVRDGRRFRSPRYARGDAADRGRDPDRVSGAVVDRGGGVADLVVVSRLTPELLGAINRMIGAG